jgi:hypothetical protein
LKTTSHIPEWGVYKMIRYLHSAAIMKIAGGFLAVMAAHRSATAQEYLPDPALSRSRASTTANGGVEMEWQYHSRANSPAVPATIVPISKFAGGSGYCTPAMHPHFYSSENNCGWRSSCSHLSYRRACNCR